MTKIKKKIKTKRMDSETPTKIRNKFSCLGVGERNEGGERVTNDKPAIFR